VRNTAHWADLIVWSHERASLWGGCKPLARVEWKNISQFDDKRRRRTVTQDHLGNIEFLVRNFAGAQASYAVLTSRLDGWMRLSCKKITGAGAIELVAEERPAIQYPGDSMRDYLSGLVPCSNCSGQSGRDV
jgi:hypothetical protein